MTTLDQRLEAAIQDVRGGLDQVPLPPFRPRRSAAPVVLALVLLLGVGVVAFAVRGNDDAGQVEVATQPDFDDGREQPAATPADEVAEDLPLDQLVPGPDAGEATPVARWRTLIGAAPGEFFVPLPLGTAWSPDEAKVIVYRTGAADPAHLVFDTFDFDGDPVELPFTPPDIEQVYWHPLVDDQLLYAADDQLMVFDLATMATSAVHRFASCDSVDSGVLPVAPAGDGTVSLLCASAAGNEQVLYNLATGTETREPAASDTAAIPSPSGDVLVRWNDDGSASVLDRDLNETGVELDLQGNNFGFVNAEGREWVATTLFDGAFVGTLVLLPLDGSGDPVVVVGPERGDAYPPTGTVLAAAGDKIAVAIPGTDDGLAGRLTLIDLGVSFLDPPRNSVVHQSEGLHGYWSTPFVSVSPSGVLVYSTDRGGDSVTTFVGNFIDQ